MSQKENSSSDQNQKCGKATCGCATTSDAESANNKKIVEEKAAQKAAAEKLDPTHFGDWQVNCRAIDF